MDIMTPVCIESVNRELEWRRDQYHDMIDKIPLEVFFMYCRGNLTPIEELAIESYRKDIQRYYRIVEEIQLLEQEAYICNLHGLIHSLEELIKIVEEDIVYLQKRYVYPKHAIDKKVEQIKAWKKERYEYKKELSTLKRVKYV